MRADVRAEETADQTAETRRAQSFCLAVFSAFFASLRFDWRSGFGCGLAALRNVRARGSALTPLEAS